MKRIYRIAVFILASFLIFVDGLKSQDHPFIFGADLSYVNQMEDCGADYLYRGESRDPFKIFSEQGHNLTRVRLWLDPSWWQEPLHQPEGVKPWYNDLEDVMKTFQRARDEGMELMLDIHYSDFWADPGRQLIPRAWLDAAYDDVAMANYVYNYTVDVLTALDTEGLMPEYVKVGNETNSGMLYDIPPPAPDFNSIESVSSWNDWDRHALLFNAGIRAVRDVGKTASIDPKISLHYSGIWANWWYEQIMNAGVIDFDILGFSFYYAWHQRSIGFLESMVETLVANYPDYEVMVVETGYIWSQDYGGIINEPDPEYLPVIPEKQLEYMVDYSRAVMRAGGTGVIFWEPAWVDTPCRTPWITGSSHTHVAFFHPNDLNFMENGGGRWANHEFYEDPFWPKVTFKVDLSGLDLDEDGVFIVGSFTDDGEGWKQVPMAYEGDKTFSFFTYLPEGAEGGFYFANGDTRENISVECADWGGTDRMYAIPGEDIIFEFAWESCQAPGDLAKVNVTFMVDMRDSGVDFSDGLFITGHLSEWAIELMADEGDEIFSYALMMTPGEDGAYYFLRTDSWTNYQAYRETVPAECAEWWGSDRGYVVPNEDVIFAHKWSSCETFEIPVSTNDIEAHAHRFILHQNYPNPFNPSTRITYQIPQMSHVTLTVYNMTGRRVSVMDEGMKPAGIHHTTFDAGDFASGIYIIRMQAGDFQQTRKMTLIK